MTLNEIITKSLAIMERSTDSESLSMYRAQMTVYANDAVRKIAERYKGAKTETLTLTNGTFDISALTRQPTKIISVISGDKPVWFYQKTEGTGVFTCEGLPNGAATVDVTYRFVPKMLIGNNDVPELPLYTHDIIPYYVVACERASAGDGDTQAAASVYFQLWNAGLANVKSAHMGEPGSYALINY
jgi:hypothetical protein